MQNILFSDKYIMYKPNKAEWFQLNTHPASKRKIFIQEVLLWLEDYIPPDGACLP